MSRFLLVLCEAVLLGTAWVIEMISPEVGWVVVPILIAAVVGLAILAVYFDRKDSLKMAKYRLQRGWNEHMSEVARKSDTKKILATLDEILKYIKKQGKA